MTTPLETAPDLRSPRVVLLVSPWTGKTRAERARNAAYLRAAMRDAIGRGELPIATHALYAATGALDNASPAERALGSGAAAHLAPVCKAVVAYVDHGSTEGMRAQLALVQALLGAPEVRLVSGWRWPQGSGPAAQDSTQPA